MSKKVNELNNVIKLLAYAEKGAKAEGKLSEYLKLKEIVTKTKDILSSHFIELTVDRETFWDNKFSEEELAAFNRFIK